MWTVQLGDPKGNAVYLCFIYTLYIYMYTNSIGGYPIFSLQELAAEAEGSRSELARCRAQLQAAQAPKP